MSVNIEMPKLSDTMTEGTVVKWHKQVGDSVDIGDVLAEIETDKATMEMEAFDEGTITEIKVQVGEKAAIGSVLAVLDGDSDGSAAESAPAQQSPEPAKEETSGSKPAESQSPQPTPHQTSAPAAESRDRVKASPLARKVAADLGVDISGIQGSGPAGRIVRSDVEAAAASGAKTPAAASSSDASAAAALAKSAKAKAPVTQQAAPAAAPQAIMPTAKDGDEKIELTTMRKVIASRLLTSKTTIPHFYLHLDVDAAPLMAVRKEVNDQAEKTHGNKYSVNDFILKAVINAAQAIPAINASFAGDHIVRFGSVGLSVAVAVDDGLVTPVIKEAESKSLLAISRAVKDFAVRAKDKKLRPDEFDGGTITVSNLGAWGIESFDAIVNPPQAAILSVGAAIEKPVVKDGQIVPGLRMNIGLSCDHRVVDGAVGAAFLAEVKKLIEKPALMLL
ncbi:MAG: 2-oxo acid dehydrogenase subunit E2 [Akkermansiaceae bacterium]|nr:2-oxo acid dehydrogenase subunit E2 [Akkermansiaceae bacterium]MCP5544129.1 2-oxo acid dehydrogenase subunit E2 [Akkermansiaceae bacterium]MCP5547815.1 2-oxo acid dehydrogenase subunit E2 [Akkermansiaceae bacterium]